MPWKQKKDVNKITPVDRSELLAEFARQLFDLADDCEDHSNPKPQETFACLDTAMNAVGRILAKAIEIDGFWKPDPDSPRIRQLAKRICQEAVTPAFAAEYSLRLATAIVKDKIGRTDFWQVINSFPSADPLNSLDSFLAALPKQTSIGQVSYLSQIKHVISTIAVPGELLIEGANRVSEEKDYIGLFRSLCEKWLPNHRPGIGGIDYCYPNMARDRKLPAQLRLAKGVVAGIRGFAEILHDEQFVIPYEVSPPRKSNSKKPPETVLGDVISKQHVAMVRGDKFDLGQVYKGRELKGLICELEKLPVTATDDERLEWLLNWLEAFHSSNPKIRDENNNNNVEWVHQCPISEIVMLLREELQDERRDEKCFYLGNGHFEFESSGDYVLDTTQSNVLEALIDAGGAAKKDVLIKNSGHSDAPRILGKIRGDHPLFRPFISLPGSRGKGGYKTTIRRKSTDQPHQKN